MTQELQIGRDKSPAGIGKNRVQHELLSGWKAYIPPAWLGGQGLSLVVFLNSSLNVKAFSPEGLALSLLIFAGYLWESTGFLSPEDRVNQPARFFYFQGKGKIAIGVSCLFALMGLFVLGTSLFEWKILGALMISSGLLFGYSVLRWKEYGIFKPLIVSLAWLVALVGFSNSDFLPSSAVLCGLFLLLLLDSLWLDVRDRVGDRLYGIRIRLINKRPYLVLLMLHVLFSVWLLWTSFESSWWMLMSNFILALCGLSGRRSISRWTYGLLIPLWSYFLALSALVGS